MGTIGEAIRQRRSLLRSGGTGLILNAGLVLLVTLFGILLIQRIYDQGASFFLQILAFALANGGIYALIALGYTMVYGIIELINFAHGDVFAFGTFLSASLIPIFGLAEGQAFGPGTALALVVVFVVTMLVCGVLNVSIDRIAYRPLRNAPRLAPLITAVGMSFFLEGVLFLWKGPATVHFPNILPQWTTTVGGVFFGLKDIFVIITAAILVALLAFFINRTRLGKAMRATAQDRDAAQLMGIDINRTIAATFFIGALLAGAGGIIYGLYYNTVYYQLGFRTGLIAFTAAVFGGIGNIPGAAIGGLIIGLTAAFSDSYIGGKWTTVVIFGILIGVLVFRPTGLLGMRVPEK